jgi:hypothetical protein
MGIGCERNHWLNIDQITEKGTGVMTAAERRAKSRESKSPDLSNSRRALNTIARTQFFYVIEPFFNFRIPLFVNAGRGRD